MSKINLIDRIFKVIYLIILTSPASASETAVAAAGTWLSVLPPLLAIVFALTLKRVIPALFMGIWLGAWIINGISADGLWHGLLESFQVYVLNALANPDHAAIILFSLMIGGMVGIISRNGGMQGIVNHIARWADSVRHASLATGAMGLAIFFDDYANTLVVGNTMRPVTDANRISRQKLANMPGLDGEAYLVFLSTIPYSFYPVMAIVFVFMIAHTGRDFGPMLAAERHARINGVFDDDHLSPHEANDSAPIEPVPGKPQRAMNAVVPIAVLILAVLGGLYVTGRASVEAANPGLRDIVGAADSYKALMWASFLGMLTATFLTLVQRIMDLEAIVNAWYQGLRSMLMALIILILAWSLGEISELLQTADFLVSVLGETLPPFTLPTLVFILAAATAFATGSSWGAMGILVPLVMPLTWAVMQTQGLDDPRHLHILYSSIASVLAGAVWGDHCSPISDTTILSSLASGCDHIEHVRTQLPYAVVVGTTALLAGSLPVAMGLPWWLGMAAGIVILGVLLHFIGGHSDPPGA
jgi:Na+/H+ antiporter NhaC